MSFEYEEESTQPISFGGRRREFLVVAGAAGLGIGAALGGGRIVATLTNRDPEIGEPRFERVTKLPPVPSGAEQSFLTSNRVYAHSVFFYESCASNDYDLMINEYTGDKNLLPHDFLASSFGSSYKLHGEEKFVKLAFSRTLESGEQHIVAVWGSFQGEKSQGCADVTMQLRTLANEVTTDNEIVNIHPVGANYFLVDFGETPKEVDWSAKFSKRILVRLDEGKLTQIRDVTNSEVVSYNGAVYWYDEKRRAIYSFNPANGNAYEVMTQESLKQVQVRDYENNGTYNLKEILRGADFHAALNGSVLFAANIGKDKQSTKPALLLFQPVFLQDPIIVCSLPFPPGPDGITVVETAYQEERNIPFFIVTVEQTNDYPPSEPTPMPPLHQDGLHDTAYEKSSKTAKVMFALRPSESFPYSLVYVSNVPGGNQQSSFNG